MKIKTFNFRLTASEFSNNTEAAKKYDNRRCEIIVLPLENNASCTFKPMHMNQKYDHFLKFVYMTLTEKITDTNQPGQTD